MVADARKPADQAFGLAKDVYDTVSLQAAFAARVYCQWIADFLISLPLSPFDRVDS